MTEACNLEMLRRVLWLSLVHVPSANLEEVAFMMCSALASLWLSYHVVSLYIRSVVWNLKKVRSAPCCHTVTPMCRHNALTQVTGNAKCDSWYTGGFSSSVIVSVLTPPPAVAVRSWRCSCRLPVSCCYLLMQHSVFTSKCFFYVFGHMLDATK